MTRTLRNILTSSVFVSSLAFGACSNATVETEKPLAEIVEPSAEVIERLTSSQPVAVQTVQLTPPQVKEAQLAPLTISGKADALLKSYVQPLDAQGIARFDYAGLASNAADRTILTDYIAYLGTQNPATFGNEAEIVSYWANLYNAVTVDLILQNYPLKSIRKAKVYNGSKVSGFVGPWKKVKTKSNGQTVALDDIEHKILRVKYPSPLIHYMVNCASIGCPNLKAGLWKAETLEADRDAAARAFVNSPRGVQVNSNGLVVSEIYNWFKDDFGGSKENVLKHIRQYANPELAQAIDSGASIKGYDYDWNLNE